MSEPMSVPEVHEAIRAAGGIVHSDGNIFFTRAEQFLAAAVLCGEEARGVDAARLDKLEDLALEGVVTLGVELDGGVHLTIELIGEEGRAYREKNTIRDAIDCELRGERGLAVPEAPAQPAVRHPPAPARLLEIARQTGLRQHMHGVPPVHARTLLADFFAAASHPDAAGTPPAEEAKVAGIRRQPPAPSEVDRWMRLTWFRDEIAKTEPALAYLRIDLLDEGQARANHGQDLERLRMRGGLSPNEALAIVRRLPCRPSMGEEEAYRALVAHVQGLEGTKA